MISEELFLLLVVSITRAMRGKILALIDNDSGQLCKKLIRLIIINMTILVKGRISMNIDDSVKFLNCHYKQD